MRIIEINACANRPYSSIDHFASHCQKMGRIIDVDIIGIPEWCPLEKQHFGIHTGNREKLKKQLLDLNKDQEAVKAFVNDLETVITELKDIVNVKRAE